MQGSKWPVNSAVHWVLKRHRPWETCDLSDMLTMNLEGLEMIAVLVVVVAFVKVLEQFGLLEADYDGKEITNCWFLSHFGELVADLVFICFIWSEAVLLVGGIW